MEVGRAICVFSAGILVGDTDTWLEMQRGKAWVGREKREQKMVTPGTRRLGVKGRRESRAGEGGNEPLK